MSVSSGDTPSWVKILGVILLIIVCFFSIKHQKQAALALEKDKRYIVGETKGWTRNYSSSKYSLYYSYKVDGHIYETYTQLSSVTGIKTKGAKYIVAFEKSNIKNSKMLFDKEVDYTTVVNYPDSGLPTIPAFVIFKRDTSFIK